MATTGLSLLSAGGVSAQTQVASAANAPAQASEVVVTADPYVNTKTIEAKRELGIVSDGISANQIGELPTFGLGDALASVPGVSFVINNGRGEDQFMTIRGLNPDYNSATVDGMVLPSTEETVRSVSYDVLPAVLINQANVQKTWTADQPSDAVGGVTDLRTRSAFDHPGTFISGHLDAAYWEDQPALHAKNPSGQGDLVLSKTFGPNDEFGALVLGSYYSRTSSTLNTYTLPYSYYPSSGVGQGAVNALDQTSATATSTTLKPSDSVDGLIPIPDRHRWYFYDNVRTRPGMFTRLDFNDHQMWHAHVSGGAFEFTNTENRYSQYLNRVGPANMLTATTGGFAQGSGEVDYDKYVQYRVLTYVDAGVGVDFSPNTHFDVTVNYGIGHYRQETNEDQFLQGASSNLAFNYDLSTQTSALFTPQNNAAFMNASKYSQAYYLNAVDKSTSTLPQIRADFKHNFDANDSGLGYSFGAQHRDLTQNYSYSQYRLNPVGTAPTLAQIGVLPGSVPLYNGYGQNLLLVNPSAATSYVEANGANYVRNASDLLSNTVNNFTLEEIVDDVYAEAAYRTQQLYALAGVRYETTQEKVNNYLPQPFNSQTNFVDTATSQTYSKLLPSLNLSYTPIDKVTLRGAITRTLARPEYSQLAQNSSATVSGGLAAESISNPHLVPRESTNYDLSLEFYPMPGALASVAVFEKDISNEIVTLTTTQQGVFVPGYAAPVTLTTTQPQNSGNAKVQGVEFNMVDSSFAFLPGPLKGFGGRFNAAFMDFNAPMIRMSDGSFRRLPQLIASSKDVINAALLYGIGKFNAELSYNFTSKMPISFDTNNPVNDQWWADISTINAEVRYAVTRQLELRLQAMNLTDATPQKVVGPFQNLNYSALENGRAFFAGVAFHF